MKAFKIKARQRNVKFSYCPSPVTIDKSSDWGKGNIQKFPNGVFLKHDPDTDIITHGVQPSAKDPQIPEGWVREDRDVVKSQDEHRNRFRKKDIWGIKYLASGTTQEIHTIDGIINYEVDEPSVWVCQDKEGYPHLPDSWIIRMSLLKKLYELPETAES